MQHTITAPARVMLNQDLVMHIVPKVAGIVQQANKWVGETVGLGETLGRIAPGYRADLVAFDPGDVRVHQTWIAGEACSKRVSL